MYIIYFNGCIFFFLQEKKPMSVNLQIGDKSYCFKNKTETIEDMENGHAYFALTGQNNQSYRIKMNNTHRLSGSPKKSLYNKASNTERKISLGSMSPNSECSIVCNYLKKIMGFRDPGITYIDIYSRFLFPIVYVAFIVIYFVYYLP